MKATIGLPFYNNEETLADAIRSVFAQSFQDWELILIDDGSQDRSLEIAMSVSDPRVRVVSEATNRGLAARLNQITALAQGDYLVRMDADDIMHPKRLEKQLAIFDRCPEVDVVGSAMYSIDESYAVQGVRGNCPARTTPRSTLAHGVMVHVTAVARRQWFAQHPYDESLRRSQDRDLWCRSCFDSTFSVSPHPLMYVRETAGGQMLGNYLHGCQSDRALFRKYGRSFVGDMETRWLIGKSYMKSAVHKLAHGLGMRHTLIKRRNVPLTQSERETATQVLQQIQKTSVPGLPIPSQQKNLSMDLEEAAA
ncbi:MAG: glycosyltransferase family 2 protein [Planctomycetes bacterium]|nr:glycosyltransferase family 2 protein [Planctomycetota bacterium]